MVALPQFPQRMTEIEYLQFEQHSEIKHEYINGDVRAMAGASRAHIVISHNLNRVLGNELLDEGCEIYASDMRLKILPKKYTYPDLIVVCDGPEFADDEFTNLLNPTLIIEILSPSTEAYDRGEKFQFYRRINSLREYVLVSQDKPHIEKFVKQGDLWILHEASGLESEIVFTSIGCTLTLADIYRSVSFADDDAEQDTP